MDVHRCYPRIAPQRHSLGTQYLERRHLVRLYDGVGSARSEQPTGR
jgi:hypothetical protein